MTNPAAASAYIIAARRTALGRVGGLHRNRRVEDLAAPVVQAVLTDAGLETTKVDGVLIGNSTAGGNPARLIALAAGLPETVPALTIDRQCGSGLDAILMAVREVASGDAEVVVAGGAESLSTAPWRIARPRSLYQIPHFIGFETLPAGDEVQHWEPLEQLATKLRLSRAAQDAFSLKSHLRTEAAREGRRFLPEIVPLRSNPEEIKDQSVSASTMEELETLSPFAPPNGTVTPGNISQPHDGAAMVVVVSERVWTERGRPPALRLIATAAQGAGPQAEPQAPIAAVQKLYGRLNGFDRSAIGLIEMSESSAAQALALIAALGIDEAVVNPEGGALTRGHPAGAAGAVLVVRLFTQLARSDSRVSKKGSFGIAVQGTFDGLGIAALFESTVALST